MHNRLLSSVQTHGSITPSSYTDENRTNNVPAVSSDSMFTSVHHKHQRKTMSPGNSPHKLGKVGPKRRTVDVKKATSQIVEVAHGGFHNIHQLQLDDFRVSCSEKKESDD